MVELTNTNHQNIDKLLLLLEESWEELPQIACEIDQWDVIDRVDFLEEWTLEEERLRQLEQYAEHGALRQDQLVRYEELKGVIERNRPILHRLRASNEDLTDTEEDRTHQGILLTGLVDNPWAESEEQACFHTQGWLPMRAKVFVGTPPAWPGFAAYLGEGNNLLSEVCTSALDAVLSGIETSVAESFGKFLVGHYELRGAAYTAWRNVILDGTDIVRGSFDSYLNAQQAALDIQQAAADSYLEAQQESLDARQKILDAQQAVVDSYLESQQEIAKAVQSVSFRGTSNNLDYRSCIEPRKRLGLASAA